ncbi:MAG: hypothetical protein G01um101425_221 [Candidatus Peregrinibacteria bacterium Gr01-1014_25]|nr:MAG: hypothetical protein G01um101425_221 [Candidatus Peregrinibacteria bacterium Gr01-1014_25]
MLTITYHSKGGVRLTGGQRGITAYAKAPLEKGDMLLQFIPEETPTTGIYCWPGEYDVGGVMLRGIGHNEGQQVTFLAVVDGIRCALLALPLPEWSDADLQLLGDVDVLLLPDTDPKVIQTLLDKMDPRALVLLPSEKGKVSDEVLRVCGAQDKAPVSEYKVKGLPQEGREVVVMG